MTPRTLLAIGGALCLLAGCSEGPAASGDAPRFVDRRVTATPQVSETSAGAAIDVRFQNATSSRYWFTTCSRTVERQVAGEWQPLPAELRLCTAEVYSLPANGTVERTVDVPVDATTGTHRFVFTVFVDAPEATAQRLESTPFTVR